MNTCPRCGHQNESGCTLCDYDVSEFRPEVITPTVVPGPVPSVVEIWAENHEAMRPVLDAACERATERDRLLQEAELKRVATYQEPSHV